MCVCIVILIFSVSCTSCYNCFYRSFNFDAWCKKFVSWVDQQKLRVSDLFRRFDSNQDGMLTREEFMKGLKASGNINKMAAITGYT